MIFLIFVGTVCRIFVSKKNNCHKIKLTISRLYTLHSTLYTLPPHHVIAFIERNKQAIPRKPTTLRGIVVSLHCFSKNTHDLYQGYIKGI